LNSEQKNLQDIDMHSADDVEINLNASHHVGSSAEDTVSTAGETKANKYQDNRR